MSEATERRIRLFNALSRRGYDTVSNLAVEFGVSERTIRRDISVLSAVEPIYTQCGRTTGGVYVVDGYHAGHAYLTAEQDCVLRYIVECAENSKDISLSKSQVKCLSEIIGTFSHSKYRKEV